MKYLFFDIECANCLKGEGKICSFGYVLTDEVFKIIKKKDILIDPKAPFLLGSARTGEGIKLAYPLFRFSWAHTFPFYYQEIKRLLIDKDTLPIGFATDQDINFLLYTCERYSLPTIYFNYVDVQKIEQFLSESHQPRGLDKLIEIYNLEKHIYHRSDEDALMTLEILEKLLTNSSMNLKTILKNYPSCIKSVEHYQKIRQQKLRLKSRNMQMRNHINRIYQEVNNSEFNMNNYQEKFYKKTVFIKQNAIFDNYQLFIDSQELFKHRSLVFINNLDNQIPDYYIYNYSSEITKIRSKYPKAKIFNLPSFIETLKK